MDLKLIAGKAADFLKKHAPEILVGVGLAGTCAGTVFACKATVKAKEIVEEANKKREEFGEEIYDQEALEKYKFDVTKQEVLDLAKCYILPVGIDLVSIASILAGTGILKKRFVGIAYAYTTLSAGFASYRQRVKDKYGDEEERKLYLGIEEDTLSEKVTDEDGKTHKVKTTYVKSINPIFKYCITIDENHPMWNQDPEVVVFKLLQIEKYMNQALVAKRYITYDYICENLQDSNHVFEEGALLGWRDNPNLSPEDRYKQISFGLKNAVGNLLPEAQNFKDGKIPYLVLSFNFDGPVIDIAPKDE